MTNNDLLRRLRYALNLNGRNHRQIMHVGRARTSNSCLLSTRLLTAANFQW